MNIRSAHPTASRCDLDAACGARHQATQVWKIAEHIEAAGLIGLGDKGYAGLSGVVFCPIKDRGKPQWKKNANSEHAKLHPSGERAIAQLKNWDLLRRLRCCPQ